MGHLPLLESISDLLTASQRLGKGAKPEQGEPWAPPLGRRILETEEISEDPWMAVPCVWACEPGWGLGGRTLLSEEVGGDVCSAGP